MVRPLQPMTQTAADALACLSLIHQALGAESPFGVDGLGGVLEGGLDGVSGPVRLRVLELSEIEAIDATTRVTRAISSRALSIDDREVEGCTYGGAKGSSTAAQALEACVPGADANCFALLVDGEPRHALPEGATLANLMLVEAAGGDGRPRLRETEGYRVYDVVTSSYHARQTAGIRSGRLAFVGQGHGLLSLMLVGRMHGFDVGRPSGEVTVLVRGC